VASDSEIAEWLGIAGYSVARDSGIAQWLGIVG